MELKVEVSNASLDDVVETSFAYLEDGGEETTLGDKIVEAVLARLASDPRWDRLAERFWAAVDERLAEAAPGFIEGLVSREVTAQLEQPSKTAAVRGRPASRAEAIVATEVTTQLRAAFEQAVKQALRTRRAGQ